MSGGVVRDMVKLFYDAALQADIRDLGKITLDEARKAIHDYKNELAQGLYQEDLDALSEILETGEMERTRAVHLKLLVGRYVVTYQNGGVWRALHPLALQILQEQANRKQVENNK
jgi:hypothetical protein